jgi:hypothetical protein
MCGPACVALCNRVSQPLTLSKDGFLGKYITQQKRTENQYTRGVCCPYNHWRDTAQNLLSVIKSQHTIVSKCMMSVLPSDFFRGNIAWTVSNCFIGESTIKQLLILVLGATFHCDGSFAPGQCFVRRSSALRKP